MYIGTLETKELVSIALMIMFAMAAMFFIGYKLAYNKAINYANEQIDEKVNEFKADYGLVNKNTDFILGNIEIPDFRGEDDEEK
jgi:ammonia channel protein AmtB